MIYFAYSFWQIDSWNGSPDYFQVAVDGTVITGWSTYNYASMTSAQKVQVCGTTGDSYPDLVDTRTFGRVAHTGTSLTFKMISQCDQDSTNESLGFRELTILVIETPTTTGATQALCGLSSIISLGTAWQCSCAEGKYLDSTSTCAACDSSCSSCFGSGSNQCYECASGYGFNGTGCITCASHCTTCSGTGSSERYECESGYLLYYNQCVLNSACVSPFYQDDCNTTCISPCGADKYIYASGSCSHDCLFPLQKGTVLKTCTYPCDSGEYLYWDGTCEDSCVLPLTVRTQAAEVYCDYGCASTGEYLYWDGTCASDCESPPLVIVTEHNRSFCTYPCDSDEYLYWDGTCEDSCPSPLATRTEKGENFCDYSCASTGEYLYWDGSCSAECPSPLQQTTSHGRLLCTYPCDTDEYLYQDSSCEDSCGLQYTLRVEKNRNYCDKTCDISQLWNGTCINNCYSPMRLLTNSSGTFCYLPCDSISQYYYPLRGICSSTCYGTSDRVNSTYLVCYEEKTTRISSNMSLIEQVALSKLLHHIRYIDVEFPDKLANISIMRGTNFISLRVKSSMFTKVTNWPTRLSLPSVFEYYLLLSSFLANFGDDLILLGMIFTVAMVSFILEKVFALMGSPGLKTFFNRLRILTQCNLPIMIIIQNTGDIIFFAIIEFKTFEMEDAKSLVSLSLCLVMLALILTIYLLGFALVQKFQQRKKESAKSLVDFVSNWEKFQVLFRGYNEKSLFLQSFLVVYSIRLMLPMVITYSFSTIPLFQTIAFLVITAVMSLYLIFKKPIQQQFDLINLIIIEFLILLSDACLLCLVIYDIKNQDEPKVRKFFGDVIIVCDYCFDVLAVGALIIKSILAIRTAFKYRKTTLNTKKDLLGFNFYSYPFSKAALALSKFKSMFFRPQILWFLMLKLPNLLH